MFDIGFLELLLVGVVGLLVLGPERLPKAARTTGLWIGKIKRSVSGMQREINAQLDAEELRQKLAEQQKKLDAGLDKARRDVESYVESSSRQSDESESAPGSVARDDKGPLSKPADHGNTTQPASRQQAEHEPVEPFTTASDTSPADKTATSPTDEAGASSADKDSAAR